MKFITIASLAAALVRNASANARADTERGLVDNLDFVKLSLFSPTRRSRFNAEADDWCATDSCTQSGCEMWDGPDKASLRNAVEPIYSSCLPGITNREVTPSGTILSANFADCDLSAFESACGSAGGGFRFVFIVLDSFLSLLPFL